MADEKVTIQLTLDKSDVDKVLDGPVPASFGKAGKQSGNKFSKGLSSALNKDLGSLQTKILAIGASLVTAFGGKKAIEAANVQERAIRGLTTSLSQLGETARLTELEGFAAELQQTANVADEVVLGQLKFSQAMGATVDQSKEVLTAAADMSAALDIDLNSAVRNISKTLGGYAGELGEVIPELKNLSAEQLRAGAGIDLLAKKYEGFGKSLASGTFEGALTGAQLAFGDLLEEIGFIVTKSPAAIKALGFVKKAIQDLAKEVKIFADDGGFKKIAETAIEIGSAVNFFIIKPFSAVFDVLRIVQNAINTFVAGVVANFATIGAAIGKLLNKLGVAKEVADSLTFGEDFTGDVFQENLDALTASMDSAFGQERSEQIAAFLEKLKEGLNATAEGTVEVSSQIKKSTQEVASFGLAAGKVAVDMGATIKQALAKGISGGVQVLIKSLMAGENAFDAFGKFVLNLMGDMAIQLGQMFILKGLAIEALKKVSGGEAIAVGVALTALGTIMKTYAGAGSASPSSGGGDGGGLAGSASSPTALTAETEAEELAEPSTNVVVNIQGDVLDSDATGTRIVSLINDAVDGQGVTIRRNALA